MASRQLLTQHGLIILGNSGVGKSFLANILLGRDAFKHEFSARSVTHRTEFQELTFENHAYAIFNIPGLIEADQARVNVNKREIDHAFQTRPNSLIIYVFGQQNGRIRDEDAVAFNAINKAYPLNAQSLLIVVNGLPKDRPVNYEGEVMLMLEDIISVQVAPERVCFLNHINKEIVEERDILKKQLMQVIVRLTPMEHKKITDIHLNVDEVVLLKKQIEEMRQLFEANKISFEEQIREHQERYDELMTNQQLQVDHYRQIIDRQKADNEDCLRQMQAMHEQQLSDMQTQIESLQTRQENLLDELKQKSGHEAEQLSKALRDAQAMQAQLQAKIVELKNRPPTTVKESSCFIAGTMIQMADGTEKCIEKVNAGDWVVGVDNQRHMVMFVDVEQLSDRLLYGINDSAPFFTSEHVFLTTDGTMLAVDPQASEDEEPSLRGVVNSLQVGLEVQVLVQGRMSSLKIEKLTCATSNPSTIVYNLVLDSGHIYHANGFTVFDMFPNLAQYPRMFKLLHLLWRNGATFVDSHFDDITTPGSIDRDRLENLAQVVQQAISDYFSNH